MTPNASPDATAQILDFVKTELAETDELDAQTDLLTSGLVGSLGVMRLVGFVEERFGYSVPPEDLVIENFIDIATLGQYLEQKGVDLGVANADG